MTVAALHPTRCPRRAAFAACVNARCSSEPSCPSRLRQTAALKCSFVSLSKRESTMTPLKTRILIADDHPIVLNGLRTVLNAQPDLEVVAHATDGEQAVLQALAEDPHLAILDISMPRKTGLQAAREITHRKPEVRVLMLSMHDNEQYLFESIKVGASGYVLKSAVDRDL